MSYVRSTFMALAVLSSIASAAFGDAYKSAAQTLILGMQGYSPVSYLDDRRAEPGSPRFTAEYEGVTYFFTSDQQVKKFESYPQRYLPAYGGYCAYCVANDIKAAPTPTSFKIIGGRTHMFIQDAKLDTVAMWDKEDLTTIRGKADRFWAWQTGSRAYSGARNLPASGVALDGFSPVSYFARGRAELGDPRFQAEHNGATYYFTSADQVEEFKRAPNRYEPACGGWCAFGMAIEDKFPIDPTKFKVVDGKLLLFLNNDEVDALKLWNEGDETELLRKADAHWKKVSGA